MAEPDFSLVVPVYNEAGAVSGLCEELVRAAGQLPGTWEIVFVDDGSADSTFAVLDGLAREDERVRVVRLARNFGQTAATVAGFDFSRGRLVFTLDGDGQNDPADIPVLRTELEKGYDLVCGWRQGRADSLTRMLPSRIANWLIRRVSGVAVHDVGCSLRAYRRPLLARLRLYGEAHRLLPLYALLAGARIGEIPVRHRARQQGRSKYTLARTYRVLLDLLWFHVIRRYGTRPLHFLGAQGLTLLGIGVVLLLLLLAWPHPLWVAGLLLLVLAGLALQAVWLGLVAEALVRVYYESQGRPVYDVATVLNPPAG